MDDLKRWYRQGLFAQIDALDVARERFQAGDHGAADSIRRLARGLRGGGFAMQFPELSGGAAAVEDADEDGLLTATDAMIVALRTEAAIKEESRVKILVIEDDPTIAQLIRATLSNANRDVIVVDTATDAEGVLAEEEISLVVLDIGLPDTDGRNLILRLRQRPRTAATPIFVISGLGGSQPRTECLALGADYYIAKPFDPESLSAAVSAKLMRSAEDGMHARFDALTGLRNRSAFTETLEHEMSVAVRNKMPLAVAVIDIDRFRRINDLYGNIVGDEVLEKVSRWVSDVLRGSDLVGRWGGDEFAILMPGTDIKGATIALTKIQEILRDSPVIVDGVIKVRVTCSVGLIQVMADMSVQQAMIAAERQLHLAKVSGRNRIVSPDDEVQPESTMILLGEDDDVTAKLIEHRLRREGFDVRSFANGADLAQEAESVAANLVILEARMPGVDGFELLRRLRRMPSYTDTPIIMLTHAGREKDIVRAFDLGASDYVTKPFSAAELVARVQRLIREAEGVPLR